jgi:MFS family permease
VTPRTSIIDQAYRGVTRTLSQMDVVLQLHGRAATALVLYYTVVGLWGLFLGVRNSGPTPGFRGAIAIAAIASVVQGALGFVVFAFLRPPPDVLHILYGFALALALPLAVSLVRDRTPRGQSVALGFAALFAAGLAIRGIITA